jgi:hypothetical protein
VVTLLNENSEFLRLVINSVRKDLQDLNELHTCLALHCVGNIGGAEMAEALGDEVQKLLMSPYVLIFVAVLSIVELMIFQIVIRSRLSRKRRFLRFSDSIARIRMFCRL